MRVCSYVCEGVLCMCVRVRASERETKPKRSGTEERGRWTKTEKEEKQEEAKEQENQVNACTVPLKVWPKSTRNESEAEEIEENQLL